MNADESQLRRLTSLAVKHQIGAVLDHDEKCRAVLAGMLAATKELLPADQFRDLVHLWEIDSGELAELLAIAGCDPDKPFIDL